MHNCPFFGKLFSNVYALTIDVVANYIYLLEPCCALCYGPWLRGSGPWGPVWSNSNTRSY